MSLLITSSRQQEFDDAAAASIGIEKPFSYVNHMRSPLIVEADSEIAVVSIKCERDGNLIIDERGFRIGLYWGNELTAGQTLESSESKNVVVYANIPAGSYTPDTLADIIQTELNKVATETYSNMDRVLCVAQSDSNGDFNGLEFTFSQNASSTDVKTSLIATATVNDKNEFPVGQLQETYGEGPENRTDGFNYNAGTQTLTATAGLNTATFMSHPLSSTSGVCEVDFGGATANFKIGLVRNFPEDRPCPEDFNANSGLADETANFYDEFYDFYFHCARSDANTTTEYSFRQSYTTPTNIDTAMGQIPTASYTPASAPPNASFGKSSGSYSSIRFTRFGEELKVEFIETTTGTALTILDSSKGAIKPLNLACDLLYLKIELENTVGSEVIIKQFDSDQTTKVTATDQRLYGYEGVASIQGATTEMEQQNFLIESREGVAATTGVLKPPSTTDFIGAPSYAKLNASGGQDRNWVLILGPGTNYETGDMLTSDVSQELGFNSNLVRESLNTTPASLTNDVVFDSDAVPSLLQLKNMFVRFNGLQQSSYNANKGSISKIIYACPRFDSANSQLGNLYYEPHERVYVDCNNPDNLMLSDLSVDLVDVNEQFCTDLIGTTQINFHIRKKS